MGLEEEKEDIDVKRISKKLNSMHRKLPEYKQTFEKLTIEKMR